MWKVENHCKNGEENLTANFSFVTAGGRQAIGRVTNFTQASTPNSSLIIVADTDNDRISSLCAIQSSLQDLKVDIVLIEPEIEA